MEINTETLCCTVCRGRELALNPKWDCSFQPLPLSLGAHLLRREEKTVRANGDRWFQGNLVFQVNSTDAHMNSQRPAACTRPTWGQTRQGASTEKWKEAQAPTPIQEAIYNWYHWQQKTSVFYNGVSPGILTTRQGNPRLGRSLPIQPKTPQVFFGGGQGFCFICLCFIFLSYWLIALISLLMHCVCVEMK